LVGVEHLGLARFTASSDVSRQNEPSSLFDSRQASTWRSYQSIVAARYVNQLARGT
jgi:hypothetical protein